MSRLRNVHWLAPTTMVLALVGGILLALGHHLFYESLDHKPIPAGSYAFAGKELPKQQFNTAVGTAFALLVRVSLAVTVSTAYVQIFWRSIKNTKQSPTLVELDWAKAGLDNIFGLFNIKLVYKYPLLGLLAVIFWCFPIAIIFPPATLSVKNVIQVPTVMLQVPQFDFTTLKFVAEQGPVTEENNAYIWEWSGANQKTQQTALAVGTFGQILPINPPAPNASWTLDFWGPALQCGDVVGAERDRIYTNIWNSYTNSSPIGSYAFLSWVPWSRIDLNNEPNAIGIDADLPFLINTTYFNETGLLGPPDSSVSTTGPASLFIAVLPKSSNFSLFSDLPEIVYNGQYCQYYQTVQTITDPLLECSSQFNISFTPALVYENSTLLRCDLVNTSYAVDFSYSNGAQGVQILPNMTGNSPILNASAYFIVPALLPTSNISESANCNPFVADPSYTSSGQLTTPCFFDIDAVRLLSYQGIMAAFNELALGSIKNTLSSYISNSTIMKTILAQTDELAFILESSSTSWPSQSFPGLVDSMTPSTRGDLKSTLEQLFQNFTISLLAEPYFQPNYSSPFAPPKLVNVSLESYQNIYIYDRITLWIAYGLPILLATLAVISGMTKLILSGESYSNNFSTIVRVSRTAELSDEVKDEDGSGYDPLPTYLKNACLNIGANSTAANAYEMIDTLLE